MKPDWDKLMGEFENVFDVDCTESGKDLCEKHGVQGFPTIKSGDPEELKDYSGGRDYDSIKAHAASLGPSCGPGENIGLCSDKVKAKIEKYLAMPAAELQAKMDKAVEKAKVDVPLMNKAKAWVEKNAGGAAEGKTDL